MTQRQSFITNIYLDWDDATETRSDISPAQWEKGVVETLHELYDMAPCSTSRAVLDGIARTTRAITIVPERQPLMPDRSDANAHADPRDPAKATRKGGTSEVGTTGVGGGSTVRLAFVAQDWTRSAPNASLRARDETLLHELVHGLRQARGIEDSVAIPAPYAIMRKGDGSVSQLMAGQTAKPGPYSQIYNQSEEFVAIVITNIYRSENGRPGLRRDHLGGDAPLVYPLTNPRTFMNVWHAELSRLSREMSDVCNRIAPVICPFNPLFELYDAENRFLPGTRHTRAS
jgi:hypothetical protein